MKYLQLYRKEKVQSYSAVMTQGNQQRGDVTATTLQGTQNCPSAVTL